MGFELREALKRLCVEIGWSYAVFWRAIGSPTLKHLVWEEGHWHGKPQFSGSDDMSSQANFSDEFRSQGTSSINELICKSMVSQVHLIGNGIVGQAALMGNHQWILRDVACVREPILAHLSELKNQFVSGIQTIVIIPVLPHGVVQFGSTMRVMENNMFVNHVKTYFMQLASESGTYGVVQEALGGSSHRHASMGTTTSDCQIRDDFSNIDKSLSMRCSHQLSLSSASRSLSHATSSLPIQCHENMSKIDTERPSTKKFVSSSIHPTRSSSFNLSNRLQSGLAEAQIISHRGMLPGHLSFMQENLLPLNVSRTQEPAKGIKALAEGMFGELDTYTQHQKFANLESTNGHCRFISVPACTNEDIPSSICNASGANHLSHNIITSNESQGISKRPHVNNSSNFQAIPQTCGFSSKCSYGSAQECRFGGSSPIGANLGIESANSYVNQCSNIEKVQSRGVEIESNSFHSSNEKSSPFLPLISSGDDLFDVLGLYDGSLDRCLDGDQQLGLDATCNTQLNHHPIFYSINNDLSCTEIFSESNADQLLDAVVSKVNSSAMPCLDDNISCKTSMTKISGSSLYCGSHSNDGSNSSGKKRGEYASSSLLMSNAEATASTSVRSAESTDETERVDEIIKVNRKRPRPGETPRPRPKDRQLIMDRVKELREIVPNGAKCSIDALLEKTIKHMLFLQSVAKHADKLRDNGEPKIISKDGGVVLKDNFHGGATWAFEVGSQLGSQPMTCPIIVEDLNPPREMLVEMLCEERGAFLEIADLIKGLGLTILKGVMEARKNKIWARFTVEANRDVTRMEIFLSLVRSLEPTICSGSGPHSLHNSTMPHKVFNQSCVSVTGTSDPLQ